MAVGKWFRSNLLQLPTLLVAVITLLGVNSLSSRLSTSELIASQIKNLKEARDIDRNLSILAIEHSLSSRSPVEWVHHTLLLNRLLAELHHNDQIKGLPLAEARGLSRQRLDHVVRIMKETIDDLNPACGERLSSLHDASEDQKPELNFETVEDSRTRINEVAKSPDCQRASLLGFWRGPWPGRAVNDELLTSAVSSYLAIDQPYNPNTSALGDAGGSPSLVIEDLSTNKKVRGQDNEVDLNKLSPQQKEDASAALNSAALRDRQKNSVARRNNLSSSLPHVFIHYNDRDSVGEVKAMANQIADHNHPSRTSSVESKFFVDKTLKLIKPLSQLEDCANGSYITNGSYVKYFHATDRPAAEALRKVADEMRSNGVGKNDLLPLKSADRGGLVDLSRWKLSAKVPRGQLELWLMGTGACGNQP